MHFQKIFIRTLTQLIHKLITLLRKKITEFAAFSRYTFKTICNFSIAINKGTDCFKCAALSKS